MVAGKRAAAAAALIAASLSAETVVEAFHITPFINTLAYPIDSEH
jgi:predicted dinucleotide-binding enzyme